jgi:hypothetical protein
VKDQLRHIARGELGGRLQLLRYNKEERSAAGDDDALKLEAIEAAVNPVTMASRAEARGGNGPPGGRVEWNFHRRILMALEQDGLEAFGFHQRISWESHRCLSS